MKEVYYIPLRSLYSFPTSIVEDKFQIAALMVTEKACFHKSDKNSISRSFYFRTSLYFAIYSKHCRSYSVELQRSGLI